MIAIWTGLSCPAEFPFLNGRLRYGTRLGAKIIVVDDFCFLKLQSHNLAVHSSPPQIPSGLQNGSFLNRPDGSRL